jgi:stalled ribosome rescue protein Dom34
MIPEQQILNVWKSVEGDIKEIVSGFVKTRRKYYEKVATELHQQLTEDAKRYTLLLSDGQITKDDYETLMKARYGQLKVELLSELSISKSKFDEISMKVLKIAISALIAVI